MAPIRMQHCCCTVCEARSGRRKRQDGQRKRLASEDCSPAALTPWRAAWTLRMPPLVGRAACIVHWRAAVAARTANCAFMPVFAAPDQMNHRRRFVCENVHLARPAGPPGGQCRVRVAAVTDSRALGAVNTLGANQSINEIQVRCASQPADTAADTSQPAATVAGASQPAARRRRRRRRRGRAGAGHRRLDERH